MTAEENIFGKMRGRFDENYARQCDRSLPFAAMAALVALHESEWPQFIKMFNDTFRWGLSPRMIEQEPRT